MRKASIIFGLMFILGLIAIPAFPLSIQFDFNGDEVWDTEYTFSTIGETVNMDVWLADYSVGLDDIYVVGFYIRNGPYTYDYEDLEIIDAWTYDESHGGPWKDCSWVNGQYAAVSDCDGYPFDGVDPGVDEKVKLHTIVLKATGGNGWIRTYDAEVCDVGVFSSYPDDAYATINGPCVVSIIPETSDIKSGETIQFEATEDGICNSPSYSWAVTPDCGSTIGAATGLYTAGDVMSDCSDTVTVTDAGNENIEDTATVNISPLLTIEPENEIVLSGRSIKFIGGYDPSFCSSIPIYSWSVESSIGSTISPGGTVGAKGYYRAGSELTNCNDAVDIITLHGVCPNDSAEEDVETSVTIKACSVTITPKSAMVEPEEIRIISASGVCCENDSSFAWESTLGSSIVPFFTVNENYEFVLYVAAPNEGTDIVTVTDTANYDATNTATITIEAPTSTTTTSAGPTTTTIPGPITTTTILPTTTVGPTTTTTVGPTTTTTGGPTTTTTTITEKSIEISPSEVMRSRWIPLFRLMSFKGTGTSFALFKTPVSYDSKSVLKLPALILSPENIVQIILVMPSLLTGIGFDGESETVTVTVDGVSDTFEIKMLPAPFDEKRNLK